MRLYLVQHAEALPESVDAERRLSARGREDAMRIAAFLGVAGVRVSRVLHSGKARACETAEILTAHMPAGVPMGILVGMAPYDPVDSFAARVADLDANTMLVGHLPFMARLASALVAGREEPTICAYRPGSVVCLEQDEAGCWTMAWMLHPDLFAGR